VLRGASSSVPRPERPGRSLTLLEGGGDASEQRAAPSGASVAAPVAGRQTNLPPKRYLRPSLRGPRRQPQLSKVGLWLMMPHCHLTWGLGIAAAAATPATGTGGEDSHGGRHGDEEEEDGLP
jgi:hypothetical protein